MQNYGNLLAKLIGIASIIDFDAERNVCFGHVELPEETHSCNIFELIQHFHQDHKPYEDLNNFHLQALLATFCTTGALYGLDTLSAG